MFGRFSLVLLALVITINTSMATSHAGVKEALNEFQYVMTVEGASLDQVKTNNAISQLRQRLSDLEGQGVSRLAIIETVLDKVSDTKTAGQINDALTRIEADKLSSEEAGMIIRNILAESYERGANWNNDLQAIQYFGVACLAIGLVIGLVLNDSTTTGNEKW